MFLKKLKHVIVIQPPLLHCVKSVRIRSYSGPHFPIFGLIAERYSISSRILSEWGKMRTRITPVMDTFYAVLLVPECRYLPLNSKGLAFYIKNKCSFAENNEFRVWKLQSYFFKYYTFFSHNTFFCSYVYLFELIFALLTFRDNKVRVLAGPLLRSKILDMQKISSGCKIPFFRSGKQIFLNLFINSCNLRKWNILSC